MSERELDLEETTLDNYRNLFRMYVIPHIGGRQLYNIDKRTVQDFYKRLLKEGGSGKKPLSPTTVRTVHLGTVAASNAPPWRDRPAAVAFASKCVPWTLVKIDSGQWSAGRWDRAAVALRAAQPRRPAGLGRRSRAGPAD